MLTQTLRGEGLLQQLSYIQWHHFYAIPLAHPRRVSRAEYHHIPPLFSYSSLKLLSATIKILCDTNDVIRDSCPQSTNQQSLTQQILHRIYCNLKGIKMLESHAILI